MSPFLPSSSGGCHERTALLEVDETSWKDSGGADGAVVDWDRNGIYYRQSCIV